MVRKKTTLIRPDKINELEEIGLKKFFAPSGTKWLQHWEKKVKAHNEGRRDLDLGFLPQPLPFRMEVPIEDGQKLVHDRDERQATYQVTWYEKAGRTFMQAYNPLDILCRSGNHEAMPAGDPLTQEASVGLNDLDVSKASKTGPLFLHMVLDGLFGLGPLRSEPHYMTVALANSTLDGMSAFHNTVVPTKHL